jgi:hypothetical protein
MIETLSRVIHPGWLKVMLENESTDEYHIYHRCVDCGHIVSSDEVNKPLWQHSYCHHKDGLVALELYQFRAALNSQDLYWGLRIFEWPDTNWKRAHP